MGQVITLLEAIRTLDSLDPEDTIYVAEPWSDKAMVIVARETEPGKLPEEARALGMKYFLEVFVVRDFIEDWKTSLPQEPSLDEVCARVIHYAVHDA